MAWRFDQARFDARLAALDKAYLDECIAAPLSEGICYFFGCKEGLLKIGYTRNLYQRFNRLKSNFGLYKLEILATARGGNCRERYYHRKFAEHHRGNEWFDTAPEIEAEIALLRERDECGHGIVDPFATPTDWPRRLHPTRPDQATVGGSHG